MRVSEGVDPGEIIMAASLNINTGFRIFFQPIFIQLTQKMTFSGLLFGEIHHFDDPELKKLLNLIKKTFVEIKQNIVARVIINCLPEFMIRPRLPLNV